MASNNAALAKASPVANLRSLLERSKEQIALALPRHLTPERMIRVALTAIQKTPKLQECEPLSVIGSVVTSSQLGLEPDGILGQAYLVPFWNGKTRQLEAQLQIGYRGLIALARRSGEVSSLYSELVFEKDKLKVVKGDSPRLQHEPNYLLEDRGDLIGAYAVVVYKDGSKDWEFMPLHELNRIRDMSKSRDRDNNLVGPWVAHPEEMYRKVPIRRLAKRLPLSVEFQRAAMLDEYADAGVSQQLDAELANSEIARERTEQRAAALVEKYKPEDENQERPENPPPPESVAAPAPPAQEAQPGAPPDEWPEFPLMNAPDLRTNEPEPEASPRARSRKSGPSGPHASAIGFEQR